MKITPLQKILSWFKELDKEVQIELVSLCYLFHYDSEIRDERNLDIRIEKLISYLNSESIDEREIVARTLFTTQLFDVAFNGRSTEADWDKSFDNNLDAKNLLTKKGIPSDFIDNVLSDWQNRKYLWINLSNSWEEIKVNSLSIDEIERWYFSTLSTNK